MIIRFILTFELSYLIFDSHVISSRNKLYETYATYTKNHLRKVLLKATIEVDLHQKSLFLNKYNYMSYMTLIDTLGGTLVECCIALNKLYSCLPSLLNSFNFKNKE
jgi:hypothetical protein